MAHSSTYIAGLKFRPEESRKVFAEMPEGEPLTLEADPTNEYDPGAIKVMAGPHHVGFIPKDHAEIRDAFAAGKVSHVVRREGNNKISVHFVDDEAASDAA